MYNERLKKRQVLGIGVAALGTFAVIAGGTLNINRGTDFLLGSLILLSTPFLWATYTLVGKKIMEKYSPFLVVAYVNMLGGLCLIPFSLAENSFHEISSMSLNAWLAVSFLAFTCSLLGYFIWFHVIKQVRAAVTSSFMFAEPLITGIFATFFVGEEITLFTYAGGFLIFLGVYLTTRE
jgi:drug/metabolite transporter (DMT)-like permease